MSNYDYRHKQSGVRWLVTVISILLLAVFVAAACTQGFKNANPWGWFDKKEEEPKESTSGMVLPETVKGNGVSLMSAEIPVEQYAENGISPQAESAYRITATAYDAAGNTNSTYNIFNWTMDWKEPHDRSVMECIELQSVDNVATITCMQPFDMQIFVTATSVLNEEVSATAILDYAKRIDGIWFGATGGILRGGQDFALESAENILYLPNADKYSDTSSAWHKDKFKFVGKIIWGEGTIANEIDNSRVSVTVGYGEAMGHAFVESSDFMDMNFSPVTFTGESVLSGITPKQLFDELAFSQFPAENFSYLASSFMGLLEPAGTGQFFATVTVPLKYGSAYTTTYYFGGSVQPVTVVNVGLDNSQFVF